MKREIYTPASDAPQTSPSREIAPAMGKEAMVRMLADFYRCLGRSPIAHMFPSDETALLAASQKSAAFFIQITGGPPDYSDAFGPPRMRARHLEFEIDEAARKAWLACFYKVLENAPEQYGFPAQHLDSFKHWLDGFSTWMKNKQ